MIAKTLWASVAIMLIAFANAEYDVAKYCQLVETGTQLPSMISCQTYYTCGPDGQPIQADCTAGTVFSKNAQSCVDEANSNCYFGLTNPCENKDKQFAPNVQACNQWYYCVDNKINGSGSCLDGQIFDPTTDTCIYGHCESGGNGNGFTDVPNVCLIMPDGVFFGDNKQCNAWHRCNGMNKQDGVCLDQLVFDAKTGQCLTNDGNMCDRTGGDGSNETGGVGSNQAGGSPDPSLCTSTTTKSVGDEKVCSVYYSCESVKRGRIDPPPPPTTTTTTTTTTPSTTPSTTYKWVQHNCINQYFDVISGSCTSTSLARPYPGCNRCEFTTGNPYWANDIGTDCSKYSTCENGKSITTGTKCPDGYYFNEPAQYCVSKDLDFQNYIKNHGACQSYECPTPITCKLSATTTVKPT